MRQVFLLLAAFSTAAFAQSVTDVQSLQAQALTASTVVLTVTASQGDGTVCTLTKSSGGSISAVLACKTPDGKTTFSGATLRSSSAASYGFSWGFSDVLCLIGVNPTTTAVPMGSLGTAPVNGIAWSCSTNIRSAGTIIGQTAPTSGTVAWP